jgi:hypothetical protein
LVIYKLKKYYSEKRQSRREISPTGSNIIVKEKESDKTVSTNTNDFEKCMALVNSVSAKMEELNKRVEKLENCTNEIMEF